MAQFSCKFGMAPALAAALLAASLLAAAPTRADPLADGLDRLAEILGAVHHLRDICGADEGPLWRNKMIDLLNAAEPDALRRQILISHFNDAYHRALAQYSSCTPAAAAEVSALFEEGRALSARLAGGDRSAAAF